MRRFLSMILNKLFKKPRKVVIFIAVHVKKIRVKMKITENFHRKNQKKLAFF